MKSDRQNQEDAVKFLISVSEVYKNGLVYEDKFRLQFTDGYLALKCFLDTYAHTRQRGIAVYPKIACECLNRKYEDGKNWGIPTKTDAMCLWELYEEIAEKEYYLWDDKKKRVKINAKCNPMNSDRGVIIQIADRGIPNLADYVKCLIEKSNLPDAHSFIKSIRGIGEKIASFYLRDIVFFSEINEDSLSHNDLCLLQPIDTWLDKVIEVLFEEDPLKMHLKEKQRMIVDFCLSIRGSCISFNMGAWLFGSQIAEEIGELVKALSSVKERERIVTQHIKKRKNYLKEVEKLLDITDNISTKKME